jgi:hypothetical protein
MNIAHNPTLSQEKNMNKHFLDFLIGCFAALCAVFVPRMLAMLNSDTEDLQFFHASYVVLGAAFSLVIGIITAIFEQYKNKSAAETFMTALGIPALLAGALNTGTATSSLQSLATDNQKLTNALQQKSGIPVEEGATVIVPLQIAPDKSSRFDIQIIPSAMAQTMVVPPADDGLNFGIQVEQKSYVVVLDKTGSRDDALDKADKLRKTIPSATVVQSNQDFLVVDSAKPSNKTDALLKALDLQNRTGQKPYLLQVNKTMDAKK